jgi:hypothetical protein
MKCVLLYSCVLFAAIADAQVLRKPMAAAYTSFGACSFNHVDIFSFDGNTAALAQLKNSAVGIYTERRFMLTELNDLVVMAGVRTASGNFGLKANYAGFADYNETQLGFAYGRKLGSKLDMGAQFNYHSIRIANDYGSASTISFELGAVLHVTEKLHTGIQIANPIGGKFGKEPQEKLSSVYSLGLGYDASEKFLISLTFEKEEDQPVNVNAGFQYKFIPRLLARAGMSSATGTGWLGLGFMIRSLRIDLASSYHPQLGITPGLLLLFHFNSGKK